MHVMYALLSSSLDGDSKIRQGKGVGERANTLRSVQSRIAIYIYIVHMSFFSL